MEVPQVSDFISPSLLSWVQDRLRDESVKRTGDKRIFEDLLSPGELGGSAQIVRMPLCFFHCFLAVRASVRGKVHALYVPLDPPLQCVGIESFTLAPSGSEGHFRQRC